MPRVLAYPLLGFVAGNFILIGIGQLVGSYGVLFYPPLLLVAVGVAIALARSGSRRAQRAFVWGCCGVIVATICMIPFGTSAPLLAATLVGLAAGALVGQHRINTAGSAAARDDDRVG